MKVSVTPPPARATDGDAERARLAFAFAKDDFGAELARKGVTLSLHPPSEFHDEWAIRFQTMAADSYHGVVFLSLKGTGVLADWVSDRTAELRAMARNMMDHVP